MPRHNFLLRNLSDRLFQLFECLVHDNVRQSYPSGNLPLFFRAAVTRAHSKINLQNQINLFDPGKGSDALRALG
jgi:hypothetical protein